MNTETVLSLLAEKGYLVSRQRQIIIDALCRQRRIGVLSPQPSSKRRHIYTLAITVDGQSYPPLAP